MKKVKRTSSFDSADRHVIMAVGESSQTDCAAFIEEQKQILNEFERLKGSAVTDGHVTRRAMMKGHTVLDYVVRYFFLLSAVSQINQRPSCLFRRS